MEQLRAELETAKQKIKELEKKLEVERKEREYYRRRFLHQQSLEDETQQYEEWSMSHRH
jgi:hypothetical protein